MKKSCKRDLEKNSMIVLCLTTFGSAINYFCQIIMGKYFSINNYGTVNTIFSLILILSVIGNTAFMLISKSLSKKKESNYKIYKYILRLVNISILVVLMASIVLYPVLNKILENNPLLSIMTIICVVTSVYPILYQGVYASIEDFLRLGLYTLIIPLVKLIGLASYCFMSIPESLELYTIIIFIIFGNVLSILIGKISSKKYYGTKKEKCLKFENIKYNYLNILITNSLLMFLMNIDILSLSYFFDSEIVGLYSSVLVFGKIVYYFVTAFVTVMLPMIAKNESDKKYAQKMLFQTLFYTAVLTIIVLIPLNILAKDILGLIFGNKYDSAVPYMFYSSLICLSYSLNVILVNYLVGTNRINFTKKLFIGGSFFLVLLLFLVNKNVYLLLATIALANLIIFVINLLKILKSTKEKSSNAKERN